MPDRLGDLSDDALDALLGELGPTRSPRDAPPAPPLDALDDSGLDALIADVGPARPPPEHPPAIVVPLWRRRWAQAAAVLVAAAVILLAVLPALQTDTGPRFRGDVQEHSTLDLRLASSADGTAAPLTTSTLAVGAKLYIQVSATPAADVVTWMEGPQGREELLAIRATPAGTLLQTSAGVVAVVLDEPGTYRFAVEAEGQEALIRTVQAQ